jgi:hypothetical protein
VLGGGAVVLLQRDENFTVHRSDGRRIAEGGVGRAIREPDIVENDVDLFLTHELTNCRFRAGKIPLGLLDPCCGWSTYVKPHLSRVYLRKEVHTEQWKQQQRC